MDSFSQQGCLVHQLLGDTSHVDAGSTQTPLGSTRGGLYKIQHRNLGAELYGFLGASQTTGSTADNDEVIVEVFLCNKKEIRK